MEMQRSARALLGGHRRLVSELEFQIPVAGIQCGNDTMNGKLRDALGAEKHPMIEYRLTSIQQVPGEGVKLKATGNLSIDGKSPPVTFAVDAAVDADGSVIAIGSVPLKMSSFGVDPPSAMLGILKTYDPVTIKFDIRAVPVKPLAATR
jgi:polyisoprenoid-binding protein YceI